MTTSLIQMAARNPEDMREMATRICREYLSGTWKTINADEMEFKRISGGLSNYLYLIKLPDTETNTFAESKIRRRDSECMNEPKEVLIRIYGQTHGKQAMETLITESVVFTLLSERNLGPKLHGIFPGGRIEQYIPARPLLVTELSNPKISQVIAGKMGEIHSLDIPVCKEPEWLWRTLNRWLPNTETILSTFQSDDPVKEAQADKLRTVNFRAEVDWMRRYIDAKRFPVMFCHNDLQENNILISEDSDLSGGGDDLNDSGTLDFESIFLSEKGKQSSACNGDDFNNNPTKGEVFASKKSRKRSFSEHDDTPQINDADNTLDSVLSGNSQSSRTSSMASAIGSGLMVIDFEYCAYNYRAFDIANHFVEWSVDNAFKKYPYFEHRPERFPTDEQQHTFIREYLIKLNGGESLPTDEEIQTVRKEVEFFAMVSHFFWSMWAIVNIHQVIEFGYWEYGTTRLARYFQLKDEFLKTHTLEE